MAQETFLNYRGYRWLWFTIILVVGLTIGYALNSPIGGRNGGTVLGYSYGILAALGILYLMWFGARKRSYRSPSNTLRDALAAHVWLGIGLLLVVPLHSGFSFGPNIHTLAYILMVLTIVSGIWGAVNYSRLPSQVGSHRGKGSLKELLQQLSLIEDELSEMVADHSDAFLRLMNEINFEYKPAFWKSLRARARGELDRKEAASRLLDLPAEEREEGLRLVSAVNRKRELSNAIAREVKVQTALKAWLYFHLPLAFGCLAALIIHVFVVLYFR